MRSYPSSTDFRTGAYRKLMLSALQESFQRLRAGSLVYYIREWGLLATREGYTIKASKSLRLFSPGGCREEAETQGDTIISKGGDFAPLEYHRYGPAQLMLP